jgi:WD40 repeat protein
MYDGHTKDVKGLSISPDGMRLASASLDATIRVWDLTSGKCQRILQRKEAGALNIDWVNDEVLTAGYTSGCVRLWNAETGERIVGFLPGHCRRTNAVSASPDGKRVVSASTDKVSLQESRSFDVHFSMNANEELKPTRDWGSSA